jgi:hypothetical protein
MAGAPYAKPSMAVAVVLALTLMASAVGLAVVRDRQMPAETEIDATLWMSSPKLLDRMSLAFDDLAADVYWMRAVVYYGSQRRSQSKFKNFNLLYPLLDITTTLDQRFLLAYRMGAIFLSESYPGGPGRPDLAVRLLEKGLSQGLTVEQENARWQLMHDIGFVYFWTYRDFDRAAEWLDRASREPGAPSWLKPVVAGMLARGGDRATARAMWQEMQRSEADIFADVARLRLRQLDALDQIDLLHSLIAQVTLSTGVRPESWRDLIVAGRLRGVPVDPSGTPFAMDPATAKVSVANNSALYPMPDQLEGQ